MLLSSAAVPVNAQARTRAPGGTNAPLHRPAAAHATIVGGSPANGQFFASVAFVSDRQQDAIYSCSASVIAPTVVLTAAHCAESETTAAVSPVAGFTVTTHSSDLSGPDVELSTISHIFIEPGFDRGSDRDDAALLILTTPTSAPPVMVPAPADANPIAIGTQAVVAGWGRTAFRKHGASRLLHRGVTVVQSEAWCTEHLRAFDPGLEMCAIDSPDDRTSPCFGDSGGPLLLADGGRPLEIGIVSESNRRCSPSGPAMFTAMNAISRWVGRIVDSVGRSSRAAHRARHQAGTAHRAP
jgi:secreted trypsin-like serine protease